VTEKVTLKYQDWGGYNNPTGNERKAELPIGFWFLEKFGHETVIELGEVTSYYREPKHKVYDLAPGKKTSIKMDALEVPYSGKNVFSISTVEHIGKGDYGNPMVPHMAIEVVKKIVDQAKNYLITFPVGYFREIEQDLVKEGIDYFLLQRDTANHWIKIEDKAMENYKYSSPFPAGCCLCIITNLDVEFSFE